MLNVCPRYLCGALDMQQLVQKGCQRCSMHSMVFLLVSALRSLQNGFSHLQGGRVPKQHGHNSLHWQQIIILGQIWPMRIAHYALLHAQSSSVWAAFLICSCLSYSKCSTLLIQDIVEPECEQQHRKLSLSQDCIAPIIEKPHEAMLFY